VPGVQQGWVNARQGGGAAACGDGGAEGEWKAPPEAGLQPTIAGFNGGGLRSQSTAMMAAIQFIVMSSFIYLSSISAGHARAGGGMINALSLEIRARLSAL